jgi:hypothetical protein
MIGFIKEFKDFYAVETVFEYEGKRYHHFNKILAKDGTINDGEMVRFDKYDVWHGKNCSVSTEKYSSIPELSIVEELPKIKNSRKRV